MRVYVHVCMCVCVCVCVCVVPKILYNSRSLPSFFPSGGFTALGNTTPQVVAIRTSKAFELNYILIALLEGLYTLDL